MKSLAHDKDRAHIIARLRRVQANTPGRWGRMTAPQMVCHLTDAFRGVMGERVASSLPSRAAPRSRQLLAKAIAIYSPFGWPHGVKTPALVDAELGGTRPTEFSADVAELERTCERFVNDRRPRAAHFLFGHLSDAEWARWGYKHMDHHLRQFGV